MKEQDALGRAGLDTLLPYHASEPRDGGGGTGLWSRYPLSDEQEPDRFTFAFVAARIQVPDVSGPVQVAALHASGPVPDSSFWQRDMEGFRGYLQALSASMPTIVGGDFNATPDTVQFRRILGTGFHDAADQAGGGYTRTYPADRWFGPLIAIDHVLSRNGPVATEVSTLTIQGSDHRALLATVSVPRKRIGA